MEYLDNLNFVLSVATTLVDYFSFDKDVAFFIGCQFSLECDFGRSSLAKKQHNYCGMKRPLVRISTSLMDEKSKSLPFASYLSFHDCVIDFVLCLQYRKPITTNLDTIPHYCAFIKTWYCPEKDYISKIQSIYNQFKSKQNE